MNNILRAAAEAMLHEQRSSIARSNTRSKPLDANSRLAD